MSDGDKSLDLLGIKPVGKAAEKVVGGAVDGAKAFLSRVCLPAAEELGLLLSDEVRHWRAMRAVDLARKAEEKVKEVHGEALVSLNPRIAHAVFEEGSWVGDNVVHDMWAGILASSCQEKSEDDSNVTFVALLKQLTGLQVRLLREAVEKAPKYLSEGGWPIAQNLKYNATELAKICETDDVLRIDREMDHLGALGLLSSGIFGGFSSSSTEADLQPTTLGMHLYVRSNGFPGSPVEYWNLKKRGTSPVDSENSPPTDPAGSA